MPRRTAAFGWACWLAVFPMTTSGRTETLPRPLVHPYVYLRDVDPSIQQDIRYAGRHNFTGRRVPGYEAAECLLTRPTAEALRGVQQGLALQGLGLKVYDCYRPVRAVQAFKAWAQDSADTAMRAEFYPGLDKRELFALGYIGSTSTHSTGNTVDVTIVPLDSVIPSRDDAAPPSACTLPRARRAPDNSLDFGTGYDCFNALAHTANPTVGPEARKQRAMLVARMRAAGFRNYAREWWHFLLPGAGTSAQDFPIRAWRRDGPPDDAPAPP